MHLDIEKKLFDIFDPNIISIPTICPPPLPPPPSPFRANDLISAMLLWKEQVYRSLDNDAMLRGRTLSNKECSGSAHFTHADSRVEYQRVFLKNQTLSSDTRKRLVAGINGFSRKTKHLPRFSEAIDGGYQWVFPKNQTLSPDSRKRLILGINGFFPKNQTHSSDARKRLMVCNKN